MPAPPTPSYIFLCDGQVKYHVFMLRQKHEDYEIYFPPSRYSRLLFLLDVTSVIFYGRFLVCLPRNDVELCRCRKLCDREAHGKH